MSSSPHNVNVYTVMFNNIYAQIYLLMTYIYYAEERDRRLEAEAITAANSSASSHSPALNVPPPRAPAKVELNFSKAKRSMPARERIETDEEVQKRCVCVYACMHACIFYACCNYPLLNRQECE
jgi:hypothetical protein